MLVAAEEEVWVAAVPALALVGACVDATDAVAFCSTGARWTVVWDCPAPAPPPVCVWVTLWLVLLSFVDEDEEVFELVSVALEVDESVHPKSEAPPATAVVACARPRAERPIQQSKAKQHRRGLSIHCTIGDRLSADQPPTGGFRSPRAGVALYHSLSDRPGTRGRAESHCPPRNPGGARRR